MIGWVPHTIMAFLEEFAGRDSCHNILQEAGFDPCTRFRLDAYYADAACRRILDSVCGQLGVSEDAAFAAFAPFFLGTARLMFPAFFHNHPTVQSFLLHQPEVHNVLSAGLQNHQRCLVASKFRVEAAPGGVRVFYRSVNRLAGLYAAIARQLGEDLGQPTRVIFEAGGPAAAECVMLVEIDPMPSLAVDQSVPAET